MSYELVVWVIVERLSLKFFTFLVRAPNIQRIIEKLKAQLFTPEDIDVIINDIGGSNEKTMDKFLEFYKEMVDEMKRYQADKYQQ